MLKRISYSSSLEEVSDIKSRVRDFIDSSQPHLTGPLAHPEGDEESERLLLEYTRKGPSEYTRFLQSVSRTARSCAELLKRLLGPNSQAKYETAFLNEILVFDYKRPIMEAFIPRPRYKIERALSKPHDYLNCDCCVDNEVSISTRRSSLHTCKGRKAILTFSKGIIRKSDTARNSHSVPAHPRVRIPHQRLRLVDSLPKHHRRHLRKRADGYGSILQKPRRTQDVGIHQAEQEENGSPD